MHNAGWLAFAAVTIAACAAVLAAAPPSHAYVELAGHPDGDELILFQPLSDERRPLFASIRPRGSRFQRPSMLASGPVCCAALAAGFSGDALAAWKGGNPESTYAAHVTAAWRPAGRARFGEARQVARVESETGPLVAVNSGGGALLQWFDARRGHYTTAWRRPDGSFRGFRDTPFTSDDDLSEISFLSLSDAGNALLLWAGYDDAIENRLLLWTAADATSAWLPPRDLLGGGDLSLLTADTNRVGHTVVYWRAQLGDGEFAWRGAEGDAVTGFQPALAPVPTDAQDAAVAVGDGGAVAVAWVNKGEVLVTTRADGGEWTVPAHIPAVAHRGTLALAVDPYGAVAVAFRSAGRAVQAGYMPPGGALTAVSLARGHTVSGPALAIGGGVATATWESSDKRQVRALARDFSAGGTRSPQVVALRSYLRIGPAGACRPRGSRTLAENRVARLFSTGRGATATLWACLFARGYPVNLGTRAAQRVTPVLGGRFVARLGSDCFATCDGTDWIDAIYVHDLRSERLYDFEAPGTQAIAVDTRGDVAWIACASRTCKVLVRNPHGRQRLLARSHHIAQRSLQLRGGRVSWWQAGRRRYARVR